MKKNVLLLMIMLMLCHVQLKAQEKGIQFFKGTFNEALAEAAKQKKPLFVDFYATWCGPCKRMATTVFTIDSVGRYFNDKFISLQLDAEKGENVELAKKYKVAAFPTLAFINSDGKTLSISTGALGANELLEAARIAIGESVGFEQLYSQHRKEPNNLEVQQQLLMQAPRFLAAQDGMDAEKWVMRVKKLYKGYVNAKMGPAIINRNDYAIIQTLGENDESQAAMVDFMNKNLTQWKEAVGSPVCYYIIEYNDALAEKLAKEGKEAYKENVEKIKSEYKEAYDVIGYATITPYEKAAMYYGALYNIYKNKNVDEYIRLTKNLFDKLGSDVKPFDYGKAAQDLYYAAGNKLRPSDHRLAIEWTDKALAGETGTMDRINYISMKGDSYRELKEYDKAEEQYKMAYLESTQMEKMASTQAMIQQALQRKLAALELLRK